MIKERMRSEIKRAIEALIETKNLKLDAIGDIDLARTKDRRFGDFASNIALTLARSAGQKPQELAALIKEALAESRLFDRVEIAGPGFLNLTLSKESLQAIIPYIQERKQDFGRAVPKNKRALIEFVSANPTGGLHLGHARGAFVGDALARLLDAAGFKVTREFYINDEGRQIETLARTIHKRYRELFGESIRIEKGEYPADYVKDIAKALKDTYQDRWLLKPEEEWLKPISSFGVAYNIASIKRSLDLADIRFDEWFFEHQLHEAGVIDRMIDKYHDKGMTYQAEVALGTDEKIRREDSKAAQFSHLQQGGLFLKTSQFGDDEDRIIRRQDGRLVYFAADLAYHDQKFERGYELMVDVFGADHAGHIGRIKAGMKALDHDIDRLKFVVVQIVRLIKDGQELRFSKRSGEVVGLDDLIEEAGKDAARFVFLMRSSNAQFDFDLDLVKKASVDNPVFYVQYGHARMATILRKAKEQNIDGETIAFNEQMMSELSLPEEREMLLILSEFEELVLNAADALEPHRLIYFCQELIKIFHSYFTKYRQTHKIISDDELTTKARLAMVFAVKQAIFNALSFLGISAPEHMENT